MSKPVWHIKIELELVNGTAGAITLNARDQNTLREVRAQFDKALRMAETLATAAPAEERQGFKVVS